MFDFGNFSAQSFERLIQTVCTHALGPGVAIFGSGPDGAREATFNGEVSFPSTADRWNGYIVVQAKHREKLRHDINDAKWLISQINNELNKFLDGERDLKKPEYYIIATNVALSSVAEIGGKDKVNAVLENFKTQIGLKGYHVWGADELTALLNAAPDIRTTFAAWVTPSDVLVSLLEQLARPNLTRLLPLALARDLRNERDVRLRDAGQESEKSIFLDSVFVDLPVETVSAWRPASKEEIQEIDVHNVEQLRDDLFEGNEDDDIDDDEVENTSGVVGSLLTRAADKLDPDSCELPRRGPRKNRIVILGGPGQGKSTIGQFISQVARARLLSSNGSCLTPQTAEILKPIIDRAICEGLPTEGPARFPIRLDLPTFSDLLAVCEKRNEKLSLFAYIAQRLSKDLDSNIEVGDLRIWLKTCPWLVMLDGLDEVPPSGNRKSVIEAIDAFWDEVYLAKGDVLVVVTSRPQGYNEALSTRHWEHWRMTPLTEQQALRFADCLSVVRLSDAERRQLILSEIKRAVADPATKMLATSPLQVTILFGIALLRGSIPQDRWDLFERYYTLLRDREAQKSSHDAALFREFKRQIDAVHHEAGFILQVAAESAGGATAFLTPKGLESLIRQHLEADEFDRDRIEEVVSELSHVATERLVLLASRVEGRISFDVRSLQEFMAAARITSVGSVPLQARLRPISTSAHWRHVYRIASSRIFSVADLGSLRNDVVAICHALDSGDFGDDERITKSGASLALDILADGIAESTPKFKKSLLRRAMSGLDVGPRVVDDRLVKLFDVDTADIFKEEITKRLLQEESLPKRSGFRLLNKLLHSQERWAEAIILENFPESPDAALTIFRNNDPRSWTNDIVTRFLSAQAKSTPQKAKDVQDSLPRMVQLASPGALQEIDINDMLRKFSILPTGYRLPQSRRFSFSVLGKDRGLVGRIASFKAENLIIESPLIEENERWAPIIQVSNFAKDPNSSTLSVAIRSFAASSNWRALVGWRFPWPIASILHDAREGANLHSLADAAKGGSFGDFKDWEEAENRLAKSGVVADDFLEWNGGRYLSRAIAEVGTPYFSVGVGRLHLARQEAIISLVEIARKIADPKKQQRILENLAISLRSVTDTTLCTDAFNFVLSTMKADPSQQSTALISSLARNVSEAWQSEEFLMLLLANVKEITGDFWTSDALLISDVDFTGRWRGLLPLVAKINLNNVREGTSHPIKDIKALRFRDGDSVEVSQAIATILILSGDFSEENFDLATDAMIKMETGSHTFSQISSGWPIEVRKRLIRIFIRKLTLNKSMLLAGYIALLQREVEGGPSRFTIDAELELLDLPSPIGKTSAILE